MEKDLVSKVSNILAKGENITEHELRSAMVIVRKLLELKTESIKSQYQLLSLFCNWAAHTEITQSNTGLRIIARVNDTLVSVRDCTDLTEVSVKISETLSFTELRIELENFLALEGVYEEVISNDRIWEVTIMPNLIEILRDVPLAFPEKLDPGKQRIYKRIAQNPIKPGAGVISLQLSKIDCEKISRGLGECICIVAKMADTTTKTIPLIIDARSK